MPTKRRCSFHVSILLIHHLRKGGANDPMDEISGSTGLTGATDCNMVLQRERGKREAILYITGRDVEEQALSLTFDEDIAHWSINEAPRSAKISPDRQAILDLLEASDRPMSPVEIADMLSIDIDKLRKKLYYMCKSDLICNTSRGLYQSVTKDVVQSTLDQLNELF
ncbi:MAG: hypothetical protein JO011_15330 [Ktedonobacteraceae bacterium]|nr:hypothetical protein [Ktedonobacteraceae bacterium]